MQVKKSFSEPKYKPVKLEITFDNEDEVKEFFTIFNYTPITDSLFHLNHAKIRSTLQPTNYYGVFKRFGDTLREKMRKGYEDGK